VSGEGFGCPWTGVVVWAKVSTICTYLQLKGALAAIKNFCNRKRSSESEKKMFNLKYNVKL
jgi:hypothetical protein